MTYDLRCSACGMYANSSETSAGDECPLKDGGSFVEITPTQINSEARRKESGMKIQARDLTDYYYSSAGSMFHLDPNCATRGSVRGVKVTPEMVQWWKDQGILDSIRFCSKCTQTSASKVAVAVTIGQGGTVHEGYQVGENFTGSLCNPYAWERSRVKPTDADPNCPRCAKAVNRAAEQTKQADRTGPTIDSADGYEYTPAPEWVQKACRRRFEGGGATGMDPKNPGHYLHGIGNFWDGPHEVKDNGDGTLSFTNPYDGTTDRFDETGYFDKGGVHHTWGSAYDDMGTTSARKTAAVGDRVQRRKADVQGTGTWVWYGPVGTVTAESGNGWGLTVQWDDGTSSEISALLIGNRTASKTASKRAAKRAAENPEPSDQERLVRFRRTVQANLRRQASEEPGWVPLARRVVQNSTMEGGLDLFSASTMLQIYDALNETNKAKIAAMPLAQAQSVCFQLAAKVGRKKGSLSKAADSFWDVIDAQLAEARTAKSAADVLRIFATSKNPYGDPGITGAPAFFAGSGGDETLLGALKDAGWKTVWAEASYHWCAQAPDGSVITYVEGDIYPENQRTGSKSHRASKTAAEDHEPDLMIAYDAPYSRCRICGKPAHYTDGGRGKAVHASLDGNGKADSVAEAVQHIYETSGGKRPASISDVAYLMGTKPDQAKAAIERAVSNGQVENRATSSGAPRLYPKTSAKTAADHSRCDHFNGYCEVLKNRNRRNDFSLSDAKNDEGEWIMSPEQIRSEMNYDPYEDPDDFYRDASKTASASAKCGYCGNVYEAPSQALAEAELDKHLSEFHRATSSKTAVADSQGQEIQVNDDVEVIFQGRDMGAGWVVSDINDDGTVLIGDEGGNGMDISPSNLTVISRHEFHSGSCTKCSMQKAAGWLPSCKSVQAAFGGAEAKPFAPQTRVALKVLDDEQVRNDPQTILTVAGDDGKTTTATTSSGETVVLSSVLLRTID